MKNRLKANGDFKQGKNTAKFENIPVFVIYEGDNTIYYTPVFDLSG